MSTQQQRNPIGLNRHEENDDVETPTWLYDFLNRQYNFDFDPCPYKCQVNNLDKKVKWGKSNYINPPYSDPYPWVSRALDETKNGNSSLLLIPVRTDNEYWRELIFPFAESIEFLSSKIQFKGYKQTFPFPLALVRFTPKGPSGTQIAWVNNGVSWRVVETFKCKD